MCYQSQRLITIMIHVMVIMDTITIHTAIKSGTFGDYLRSLWFDEKCRIYEINRIESPCLYDENA
jgi:hypothetical protein